MLNNDVQNYQIPRHLYLYECRTYVKTVVGIHILLQKLPEVGGKAGLDSVASSFHILFLWALVLIIYIKSR